MKNIIAFLSVLALASCKGDPISTERNGDFKLELLFEKDGCKVYRFIDGSDAVYWSNCAGSMQHETSHTDGKGHAYTDTHHEFTTAP